MLFLSLFFRIVFKYFILYILRYFVLYIVGNSIVLMKCNNCEVINFVRYYLYSKINRSVNKWQDIGVIKKKSRVLVKESEEFVRVRFLSHLYKGLISKVPVNQETFSYRVHKHFPQFLLFPSFLRTERVPTFILVLSSFHLFNSSLSKFGLFKETVRIRISLPDFLKSNGCRGPIQTLIIAFSNNGGEEEIV